MGLHPHLPEAHRPEGDKAHTWLHWGQSQSQSHCCHRDDPNCLHPHCRCHTTLLPSPWPLLWVTFATCVTVTTEEAQVAKLLKDPDCPPDPLGHPERLREEGPGL